MSACIPCALSMCMDSGDVTGRTAVQVSEADVCADDEESMA